MSNKTIIIIITTLTVPSSSTDREIVIWDGTTGKKIGGGHGVLISAAGDIEDVRTTNILAGPSNPGDDQTVWIRAADGHLMRGEVDLEDVVGGPASASSTDNAITRWDGTDGTMIQDSTVLLSDTNVFTVSGQTLLYADPGQRNFFAGRTPLATMTGTHNTFVGVDAGFNLTSTAGSNNTALGCETLANLGAGSSNIALGAGSGSNYTGTESGNICVGALGVVLDDATTRIGTNQTRCFVKGIHGVTPAGAATAVVIDADGQLGTASGGSTLSASETTGTIIAISPVGFSIEVKLYKIGKMVTIRISAAIFALSSPELQLSFGNIPVEYRPEAAVEFATVFVSGGVYDTGLIGHTVITATGAIIFYRDQDGSPSSFENDSGWDNDLCFTWLTA